MITINLNITAPDLTPQQEGQLKTEIRRAALQFIFAAAERVNIDHTKVKVSGDIKLS